MIISLIFYSIDLLFYCCWEVYSLMIYIIVVDYLNFCVVDVLVTVIKYCYYYVRPWFTDTWLLLLFGICVPRYSVLCQVGYLLLRPLMWFCYYQLCLFYVEADVVIGGYWWLLLLIILFIVRPHSGGICVLYFDGIRLTVIQIPHCSLYWLNDIDELLNLLLVDCYCWTLLLLPIDSDGTTCILRCVILTMHSIVTVLTLHYSVVVFLWHCCVGIVDTIALFDCSIRVNWLVHSITVLLLLFIPLFLLWYDRCIDLVLLMLKEGWCVRFIVGAAVVI